MLRCCLIYNLQSLKPFVISSWQELISDKTFSYKIPQNLIQAVEKMLNILSICIRCVVFLMDLFSFSSVLLITVIAFARAFLCFQQVLL